MIKAKHRLVVYNHLHEEIESSYWFDSIEGVMELGEKISKARFNAGLEKHIDVYTKSYYFDDNKCVLESPNEFYFWTCKRRKFNVLDGGY